MLSFIHTVSGLQFLFCFVNLAVTLPGVFLCLNSAVLSVKEEFDIFFMYFSSSVKCQDLCLKT